MIKKRYSLTLLEVVIALSIMSILLFVLLRIYKSQALGQERLSHALNQVYQKHEMYAELERLFSHLVLDEKTFYTQEEKGLVLHLEWDNGTQIDPKLAGIVEGKLSSKEGKLLLEIVKKDQKIHERTLFSGAEELFWQFYNLETNTWEKTWRKENKRLPAMVKMGLKTKKSPSWEILFFIHSSANLLFQEK